MDPANINRTGTVNIQINIMLYGDMAMLPAGTIIAGPQERINFFS